jgi:hypothetical protein
MTGKNKCPYCQQVDHGEAMTWSRSDHHILICLKIPMIIRDNKNEYIYINGINTIYINQKAKLLELTK